MGRRCLFEGCSHGALCGPMDEKAFAVVELLGLAMDSSIPARSSRTHDKFYEMALPVLFQKCLFSQFR